jgi:hypothetical protein
MISWAVFAPPVLAKQALPEMGLDPAWIAMQPTILFTAATFSSMMSAGLVARINPMRASQAMVLLCAVGSAMIASGNLVLVALGSALIGLGLGPATPASCSPSCFPSSKQACQSGVCSPDWPARH